MHIYIYLIIAIIAFLIVKKLQGAGINKISSEDVRKAMETNENIQFIDVRTDKEISNGKIKNAKTGFDIFDDRGFKLSIENISKEGQYIIYCASGNRSLRACRIMKKAGFKNIYSLTGGYSSWKKSNK